MLDRSSDSTHNKYKLYIYSMCAALQTAGRPHQDQDGWCFLNWFLCFIPLYITVLNRHTYRHTHAHTHWPPHTYAYGHRRQRARANVHVYEVPRHRSVDARAAFHVRSPNEKKQHDLSDAKERPISEVGRKLNKTKRGGMWHDAHTNTRHCPWELLNERERERPKGGRNGRKGGGGG